MGFGEKIRAYRHSRKRYLVSVVLMIAVIALFIFSYTKGRNRQDLVYRDSLELKVLTVDGREFVLKDLAFYIAFEEDQVEDLARVYDYSNPNKYWNLHIDGVFVKVSAKSAIMQMAVHDEILYQMALKEEILLNEEEMKLLDSNVEDFWNDLKDRGGDVLLGVDKETISLQMEKIALAEKYQIILAETTGYDYEDYEFSKEAYAKLLEEHNYKIVEKVWNRIPIGDVTLEH